MIETVLFLVQSFLQLAVAVFLVTSVSVLAGNGLQSYAVPNHAGFTHSIGLGLSGIGLSLATSYALIGNIVFGLVLVWILIMCGAANLVWSLHRRKMSKCRVGEGPRLTRALLVIRRQTSETWVSRALLLVTFFPFLKWGPTYVTRLVNDLPNYAASVKIWRYGMENFAYLHPDNFGALQLSRASYEKPFVTGLMSAFEIITRVDSLRIFSPIFVIGTLISIKSLKTVIQLRLRDVKAPSLLATLPFIGFWHAVRVVDSQPGHILCVMFICLTVEQFASSIDTRVFDAPSLTNIAFFSSAGLLSNPTLFLTASPLLLILLVTIVRNPMGPRLEFRGVFGWRLVLCVLPIFGVLSTRSMMLKSVRYQTSENFGFPSDFPSPLVFFGLDKVIKSEFFVANGARLWVIFLLATIGLISVATTTRKYFGIIFVSVAGVITLIIGFRLGFTDYSIGKWVSVLTILVIPFGVILMERSARVSTALRSQFSIALIAVIAAANSLAAYDTFDGHLNVIPPQAFEFEPGSSVRQDEVINVELSNLYRASTYALIRQTNPTVISEPTYARASVPIGDIFLIEPDTYDAEFEEVISHPDGVVLIVRRKGDLGGLRSSIEGVRALHKLVAYPKHSWESSENGIVLPDGRYGGVRISLVLPENESNGEPELILKLASDSKVEVQSFAVSKEATLTQLDSDSGLLLSVTGYESKGGGILEIWLEVSQPGGGDLEISGVEFQGPQ